MTVSEILDQVAPEKHAAAERFIQQQTQPKMPFFVRAVLFVGALLAAGMLVLGIQLFYVEHSWEWVRGAVLMAIGFGLIQMTAHKKNVLVGVGGGQLGHLLGLAGQILVALAWVDSAAWVLYLVLAAVSYPIFRNSFNRFLWCAVAATCLYENWNLQPEWQLLASVGAFAAAYWIFIKRKFSFYPLAYALIWWCAICAAETATAKMAGYALPLAQALLAGAAAVRVIGTRKNAWSGRTALLAALGILAAALLNWPTLLALILMYAGFTLRDRVLESVGTAGVIAGLFLLYFAMPAPLSVKAAWLMGSGLAVLGARRLYA